MPLHRNIPSPAVTMVQALLLPRCLLLDTDNKVRACRPFSCQALTVLPHSSLCLHGWSDMQGPDEAEAGVCRRRTAPQPQPSRQPEGCRACRLCALQSGQSSQVGAAREVGVDGMPLGLSWAAWLSLDWTTHNGMWNWPGQPHIAGVCPRFGRRSAP